MIDDLEFRESTPADFPAIEDLYRAAFPTEDLLPLVRELLTGREDVLSLVGTAGPSVIAHVVFTKCSVDGYSLNAALLGPLAVSPDWQKKGIGSLIVGSGFKRLKNEGIGQVFVLGDPTYYSRFGFTAELEVTPAYPLPDEWKDGWQSVRLGNNDPLPAGKISLPDPWLRKELWVP